jgi:molybdopterin-guanine dinucleotide biosynthesis protein A
MVPPIAGVILAGGRSTRMGGRDKALLTLAGRPLIRHVIDRLRPQVGSLALNANGEPARFADLGLPVIPDTIAGYAGPLAGILAGLLWARRQRPMPRAIVTAATDTPFFPLDLVRRLAEAAPGGTGIAVARTSRRIHPVFAYFPIGCTEDLEQFLSRTEARRATDWLDHAGFTPIDFAPGEGARDPFFNVNTPADLAAAEASILHDPFSRKPER